MKFKINKGYIRQFKIIEGVPDNWNEYAESLLKEGIDIYNVKLEGYYPDGDYSIISYDIYKAVVIKE